jgi:hypothetical protein
MHRLAGQPPQDRHHELEKAEVKRQPKDLVSVELSQRQSGNNGDGECVHGQAKSDPDDNPLVHVRPSTAATQQHGYLAIRKKPGLCLSQFKRPFPLPL